LGQSQIQKEMTLTLPTDNVEITPSGLEFKSQPTVEQWTELHSFLLTCRRASLRWIADSRKAGREYFGDELVTRTEEQLMFDLADDRAATALEKLEFRNNDLTDAHLLVLAKRTKTSDQFDKWSAAATEHKLSPRELDRSIKAGKVVVEDDDSINANDKSTGIVTIEGVSTMFDMWLRKAEEFGFPEKWDKERLQRVSALLANMVATSNKINQLL
jgi:hypothetical protein